MRGDNRLGGVDCRKQNCMIDDRAIAVRLSVDGHECAISQKSNAFVCEENVPVSSVFHCLYATAICSQICNRTLPVEYPT